MTPTRYNAGKPKYVETLADSTLAKILASMASVAKSQGFMTAEQQDRFDHYERESRRRQRKRRQQGVMP